jgi:hypothetical protein
VSKKVFVALLFIVLATLCGCNFSSAETIEELEVQLEIYEEQMLVYEDAINYYEGLCDNYGYLTYAQIHYPEMWKYFIDTDSNVWHCDSLCPKFIGAQHGYISANDRDATRYTECKLCSGADLVYLDINKKVMHGEKRNLDLGTDDYVKLNAKYTLGSTKNAIINGYKYCNCCDFD